MTDEWWKDFFSGLVVDFWRGALPPEVTLAEAGFLEKHLRLAEGARVLDAPCGAGRLAIELAARGYRMTGVDISAEFIGAAREGNPSIAWRVGDMRDLPWDSEFDAAYCAGSSFGFLGDEGDAEFLRAVARTLTPGGRFFADFKAAESLLPNFRESHEMRVGDIEFRARNRYEPATGTMESLYTITLGDRVENKRAVHRIYTCAQILRMLESAGFGAVETYGSLKEEPFRLGSPTLVVVAAR
ncbi:MAG TPA: class I SAM-dependent methyltransferase [Thermoanaerobaculia bacterium]